MRLHLIDLLGLGPSPCLLPSALAHHVETLSSPSKVILPHFFYFWINGFLLAQQRPGVDRRNQNTKYIEPMPFHKIPFGGDAGNRTRVHSAFTWKELQQYRYYTTHLFMCQSEPTHHQFLRNWKLVKEQQKDRCNHDNTNGKTKILVHVICSIGTIS